MAELDELLKEGKIDEQTFKDKVSENKKASSESYKKMLIDEIERQKQVQNKTDDDVLYKNVDVLDLKTGDREKKDLTAKEAKKVASENKTLTSPITPPESLRDVQGLSVNLGPTDLGKELNKKQVEDSISDQIDSMKLGGKPIIESTVSGNELTASPNQEVVSEGVAEIPASLDGALPNQQIENTESFSVKAPVASNVSGVNTGAFNTQMQATRDLAKAEQEKADQLRELYSEKARLEEESNRKLAEKEEERAKRKQEVYDNYQKAVDEVTNTVIKEPNIWADKSTGGKILTALGLFLGAAPNSSGQNTAVAVLEKQMERNLEVQKMELQKKKEGVAFKRNLLTDLDDVFKDERARDAAFEKVQLNTIENKIKQLTDISSNATIKANADLARGAIQERKAEFDLKLQNAALQQYMAETERMEKMKKAQAALTPFEEKSQEKSAEAYVKALEALPGIETQIGNQRQAWDLLKKVETGPISGSSVVGFGRKVLGDQNYQKLENIFSKEGLEAAKRMAETGGARSIDSDAERKFVMQSVPGLNKDNKVNQDILLASNAILQRNKLDTRLKQVYVERYGNLNGYVSPLENMKTYYNQNSGEVRFAEEGKSPKGFQPLAPRLEGGSSKDVRSIGNKQFELMPDGKYKEIK